LDYIDFVKVYTANVQEAGWLGETSVEFAGIVDLHAQENVAVYPPVGENFVRSIYKTPLRWQEIHLQQTRTGPTLMLKMYISNRRTLYSRTAPVGVALIGMALASATAPTIPIMAQKVPKVGCRISLVL